MPHAFRSLVAILCCLAASSTALPALSMPHTDTDLGWASFLFGPGSDPAEIRRHAVANITGAIPKWIDGVWVQNGPGKWEWDSKSGKKRAFTQSGDGYGKLEVFDMRNGGLVYSSIFTRSEWWNNSVKMDDIAPSMCFSPPEPPRDSDQHRQYRNMLAPNDNYAVNVMPLNGSLLLLSDMPGRIEFDQELLTFGKAARAPSFKDKPSLPPAMVGAFGSAHPLYTGSSLDGSGTLYGLINAQRLTSLDHRPEQLRLFRIDPTSPSPWLDRHAVSTIELPKGSYAPYMHSFAFLAMGSSPEQRNDGGQEQHISTDTAPKPSGEISHAVLASHAMHIAFSKLVDGLGKAPITEGFDINKTRPMEFYLVDLGNGNVTKKLRYDGFQNDSLIVSHVINSYTEGGSLIYDLIGYDWLFFDRFTSNVQLNKTARDTVGHRAKTYRFSLPLDGSPGRAFELLPGRDFEFPTINEAYKGRKYCYVWGYENSFSGNPSGATGFASMAIIKYDACTNTSLSFSRPYHYFAEPFFVPRPGATAEDDGAVLVLAQDGANSKGKMLVLDASDMSLLATAELPLTTAIKTHGRFVWRSALRKSH